MGKTILLVDDDKQIQLALTRAITDLGHTALQAVTIAEARERFKTGHTEAVARGETGINIILMDGDLGPDEGYTIDLIRELRPQFTGTIVSTTGNYKLEQPMMDAGCDLQFPKPFGLQEIKRFLDRL